MYDAETQRLMDELVGTAPEPDHVVQVRSFSPASLPERCNISTGQVVMDEHGETVMIVCGKPSVVGLQAFCTCQTVSDIFVGCDEHRHRAFDDADDDLRINHMEQELVSM